LINIVNCAVLTFFPSFSRKNFRYLSVSTFIPIKKELHPYPSFDLGIEPDASPLDKSSSSGDVEKHKLVTFDSRASVKQLKNRGNVSKLLERLNQPKADE
jgi:hypothetical protein